MIFLSCLRRKFWALIFLIYVCSVLFNFILNSATFSFNFYAHSFVFLLHSKFGYSAQLLHSFYFSNIRKGTFLFTYYFICLLYIAIIFSLAFIKDWEICLNYIFISFDTVFWFVFYTKHEISIIIFYVNINITFTLLLIVVIFPIF